MNIRMTFPTWVYCTLCTISICLCYSTSRNLHILACSQIHTPTCSNETVTHLHKWKQGTVMKADTISGNSDSPSPCVLFSSHSVLFICSTLCFSAVSRSNSTLSFLRLSLSFSNNWAKWVSSNGRKKKESFGSERLCESGCWGGSRCARAPCMDGWRENNQ